MIEVKEKIALLKKELENISHAEMTIMEVCGTHTMSLAKHAIRSMLPNFIRVISGPGCPVCVTSAGDIQMAIDLAKNENFIVCSFGDMLKVPSQGDTLSHYKNVQIVYSPLDALETAMKNREKQVVLLGIGFETTAPLIAATILSAHKAKLKNFSVLAMHKTVPEALKIICSDKASNIKGLILPGHVSSITGRKYFDFIKDFGVSGVIAGFDPLDIMECLYLLVKYKNNNEVHVTNNYPKVVSEEGNKKALETLNEVYEVCDSDWRGIGTIPHSGLKIRENYSHLCALKKHQLEPKVIDDAPGCLCGSILLGKNTPFDCGYFAKKCTPVNPIGPCMVSSEGTCSAYYKYKR